MTGLFTKKAAVLLSALLICLRIAAVESRESQEKIHHLKITAKASKPVIEKCFIQTSAEAQDGIIALVYAMDSMAKAISKTADTSRKAGTTKIYSVKMAKWTMESTASIDHGMGREYEQDAIKMYNTDKKIMLEYDLSYAYYLKNGKLQESHEDFAQMPGTMTAQDLINDLKDTGVQAEIIKIKKSYKATIRAAVEAKGCPEQKDNGYIIKK